MSETKHSPEPWRVEGDESLSAADGRIVLWADDHVPYDNRDADMRRLVACVNACAGIPTAALEAGALDEALTLADVCTRCSEADGVEDLRAALRALGRLP